MRLRTTLLLMLLLLLVGCTARVPEPAPAPVDPAPEPVVAQPAPEAGQTAPTQPPPAPVSSTPTPPSPPQPQPSLKVWAVDVTGKAEPELERVAVAVIDRTIDPFGQASVDLLFANADGTSLVRVPRGAQAMAISGKTGGFVLLQMAPDSSRRTDRLWSIKRRARVFT